MIIIDKNTFVSLNALANHFNLPDEYLKQLANKSLIPFLNVNGRLKFNLEAVSQALADLAANGGGNE
jgi:hypothetical protein